jgi:hypothetical protein
MTFCKICKPQRNDYPELPTNTGPDGITHHEGCPPWNDLMAEREAMMAESGVADSLALAIEDTIRLCPTCRRIADCRGSMRYLCPVGHRFTLPLIELTAKGKRA